MSSPTHPTTLAPLSSSASHDSPHKPQLKLHASLHPSPGTPATPATPYPPNPTPASTNSLLNAPPESATPGNGSIRTVSSWSVPTTRPNSRASVSGLYSAAGVQRSRTLPRSPLDKFVEFVVELQLSEGGDSPPPPVVEMDRKLERVKEIKEEEEEEEHGRLCGRLEMEQVESAALEEAILEAVGTGLGKVSKENARN